MKKRMGIGGGLALAALLAVPGAAFAQGNGIGALGSQLDTTWVMVACVLVLFMQAGFLLLEIGFSRQKNVGAGVAKVLVNLAVVTLAWWAVGFGISSLTGNKIFGTDGFFFHAGQEIGTGADAFVVGGGDTALMLFGMLFCAVSLAIVWGTTLERIRFAAYAIYAAVFGAVIYPLVAHGVYGGGLLSDVGGKPVMDFAGSSVVHLTGAVGALAALLLLGPRLGKYGADGRSRAIPGHSMPLVGLGVIILFFGWFGFNPGSTLAITDTRLADVAVVTLMGAAGGVIGAFVATQIKQRTIDIGMVGNGMIAGLVAITAPSGYVEAWTAPIIGLVAGVIVVVGVILIDRKLDDPVGALSAHGLAGIWGTLACGIFTAPRFAQYNAFGDPDGGLIYSGSFTQLATQAIGVVIAFSFVFSMSYVTFWAIKKTIGLRVTDEQEDAGLDIVEHGMYGYPEQFIPAPEIGAGSTGPAAPAYAGGGTAATVSAMTPAEVTR